MTVRRLFSGLALIVAIAGLVGCNSDNGTMQVRMTDGPVLGYDAVSIVVTQVSAHRTGAAEGEVEILSNNTVTVPLLDLQNGLFLQLGAGSVPEGQYDNVRLTVGEGSTITIAGVTYPLRVASGVVKIVCEQSGAIVIQGGETTVVDLDFDLSKTNFTLQGNGEYHMTPVIHCMPNRMAGAITGTILPAGVDAEVTATLKSNPSETRTAFVSSTGVNAGKFQISVLAAGTYDIVIHPTTVGYQDMTISDVQVQAGKTTALGTITLMSAAGASLQ